MAYEKKLEKLGKIAAVVQQLVRDDEELRLIQLNTEDNEEDGFGVVVVIRYDAKRDQIV